MGFFSSVGTFLKGMFSGLLGVFKSFLKLALPVAKQIILAQLKDIALKAVTEMSFANLSNDEKRKEAMKRISNYAKENSIDATESLVRIANEFAYQIIKDQ